MKKVVITEAKRTPVGSFLGSLSSLKVTELGSAVISGIVKTSGIDPSSVDEVIMGNVLSAGTGQAPARQAAIFAGLPEKTECLTINKMCGSGLKAVMLAHQAIALGDADVIIAGGMESMSNAPYLLPGARQGYRMGGAAIVDSMINDGLWDVYNNIHMGSCTEECAREEKIGREEADEYAVESYNRTLNAQKEGLFDSQLISLTVKERKSEIEITEDEEPSKVKFDKIPHLRPVFDKEGIVTAANASKINDGAAALLVMSEEKASANGLKPLVEIVAHSSAARLPVEFPSAPVDSITKVLKKAGLNIDDIDLFEINEAFAVVPIVAHKKLGIPYDKMNVNGGAIALGHPIGASGARVLVTLIHELKRRNLKYGLATLCIGGGEASAVIVKNVN